MSDIELKDHTANLNGRIIEAVTVDFWATIAHDSTREQRRVLRHKILLDFLADEGLKVSPETLGDVLWQYHDWWHRQWEKHLFTPDAESFARFAAEHFQLNPDPNRLRNTAQTLDRSVLEVPPVIIEGAEEALKKLASHFKLALICDTAITSGQSTDELLRQWGLIDLFEARIYSDNVGRSKPHNAPFLKALEIIGVPQQRVVHIGDTERTDILGAKNLGMAAIRFDALKDEAECKECSMADKIVMSWQEVTTLLLAGTNF